METEIKTESTEQTTEQIREQITERKSEPIIGQPTALAKIVMGADQYREIVKTIATTTDGGYNKFRVTISPDGINLVKVDNENVMMILVNYKKTAFEMFACQEPVEIGLDNNTLKTFGKMVKKGMIVCIRISTGKTPNEPAYELSCNGNLLNGSCIDVNTLRHNPRKPAVTFESSIRVVSKDFVEAIKSAGDISEEIILLSTPAGLHVEACNGATMFQKLIPVVDWNGTARSLFTSEYLVDIVKAVRDKKEIIDIEMKTGFPVQITLQNENREIVYLLAHRI